MSQLHTHLIGGLRRIPNKQTLISNVYFQQKQIFIQTFGKVPSSTVAATSGPCDEHQNGSKPAENADCACLLPAVPPRSATTIPRCCLKTKIADGDVLPGDVTPIVVGNIGCRRVLIFGNRRATAFVMAGVDEVQAIYYDLDAPSAPDNLRWKAMLAHTKLPGKNLPRIRF